MKFITLMFATVLNIVYAPDCYNFNSVQSGSQYANFMKFLAKQDLVVEIHSENVDNGLTAKTGQELDQKRPSTQNYTSKVINNTKIDLVLGTHIESRTNCDLITVISILFLPLMAFVLH